MYWCHQADPETSFIFAAHGGSQSWSHGVCEPCCKSEVATRLGSLVAAIAARVPRGSMIRRSSHSQTGMIPSVNVVKRLVQPA